MSFALERYKYPGPGPGTFKQGLGFIFYLVTFRETYQGDQAGRVVHLAKPAGQDKNGAFLNYYYFYSVILSLGEDAKMMLSIVSSGMV